MIDLLLIPALMIGICTMSLGGIFLVGVLIDAAANRAAKAARTVLRVRPSPISRDDLVMLYAMVEYDVSYSTLIASELYRMHDQYGITVEELESAYESLSEEDG